VPRVRDFRRITRSLRFRLTVGYALFFCVMLIGVGTVFRQKLAASLDTQIREALDQEWAGLRGYLRIENDRAIWYYDHDDPDESFFIERLRRVYFVADTQGHVLADEQGNLQTSEAYQSIGRDTAPQIAAALNSKPPHWEVRKNSKGVPYLIRSGAVDDENHKPFFVAIGRSLADGQHILDQFTWTYVGVIPVVLLSGCLLGWYLAARALTPVLEVAQAANRISGSNLSLRIPSRGAGDELRPQGQLHQRGEDRRDAPGDRARGARRPADDGGALPRRGARRAARGDGERNVCGDEREGNLESLHGPD